MQVQFDRIKTLAPEHPDWRTSQPSASVIKGELKAALAGGPRKPPSQKRRATPKSKTRASGWHPGCACRLRNGSESEEIREIQ